jgi:hypothetical protein
MTQIDLEEWLISSQEDIPASRFHKPGSASAIKMTDISGQKCLGLSKQCGPGGLLEKMLLATSLWASTSCYLIWKPQVTPAGALLFRLSPQMPRTDETGSGLWPTAVAYDATPGGPNNHYKGLGHQAKHGGKLMWATPTAAIAQGSSAGNPNRKKAGRDLRQDVRMWPTPTAVLAGDGDFLEALTDKHGNAPKQGQRAYNPKTGKHTQVTLNRAVKMWPTPMATEDKAGTPNGKMQRQLGNHPAIRGDTPEEWQRGSLNPEWVEWLMGYPVGYTDCDS